jgi:cell division cycle protein 20 (cofactor of APC complex)
MIVLELVLDLVNRSKSTSYNKIGKFRNGKFPNKQHMKANMKNMLHINLPSKNGGSWSPLSTPGSPSSPTGRSSAKRSRTNSPASPTVDRFISNRSAQDTEVARFKFFTSLYNENDENVNTEAEEPTTPTNTGGNGSPTNQHHNEYTDMLYRSALENRLFDGANVKSSKILSFTETSSPGSPKTKLQSSSNAFLYNNLKAVYNQNVTGESSPRSKTARRNIASTPERILDAPALIDDFYLNLMDWSAENVLAVALSESVYLFNAETGDISKLMSCSANNIVTSVSFSQDATYLAIGTSQSDVQIWDIERNVKLRSMKGHAARVGALSWNKQILSSGSRDGKIMNHDVRIPQHLVSTLSGHTQEVCGLKWSPDGSMLASGGNDNLLNIWDGISSTEARYTLDQHQAAVKALAWCPWQSNLLASGGGTADRRMIFWNASTGAMVNSVDTKSQVCSLVWSKHDKELVSSHGFSQNQLCVWKYPSLTKVAELTGHTSRVLHLAQSPDGATIVSGAGDETLRFWKIFSPESRRGNSPQPKSLLSMNMMNIR